MPAPSHQAQKFNNSAIKYFVTNNWLLTTDNPMQLNIGDKAPDFAIPDQDGLVHKLSDYAGRKLVIYFYPKDNTPGCTAQACNLRDNYYALRQKGYEVIGVSVDSEKSHQKFIQKFELPFTLLADTEKKMAEAYGVWQEKSMYGRKYMGVMRYTFIIDEQGIIQDIITKVDTKDHARQIAV
jgi:thioredoxin-dependent peroxiredoxin